MSARTFYDPFFREPFYVVLVKLFVSLSGGREIGVLLQSPLFLYRRAASGLRVGNAMGRALVGRSRRWYRSCCTSGWFSKRPVVIA